MFRKPPTAPDITSKKWLEGELREARAGLPAAVAAEAAARDQLTAHLERVGVLAAALATSVRELARLRGDGTTLRTEADPDTGRAYLVGGDQDAAFAVAKARKSACDEAAEVEEKLRARLGEAATRLDDLRGRERHALARLAQLDAPAPARPDPMAPPAWMPPQGLWKDGAG